MCLMLSCVYLKGVCLLLTLVFSHFLVLASHTGVR
jgi:hypothetical protein